MATPAVTTTLQETLAQLQFGPDGCALDAEGHIWAADEVGARCARLAPGGEIVDEIAAPEGLDIFAQSRTANHEAFLLTTTVDVPRAGLP